MKSMKHIALIILIGVTMFNSCREDKPIEFVSTKSHSADIASSWMELTRELVKTTPGYTPPVAARAFGLAGITLYESVVAGMGDHHSLDRQLTGFSNSIIIDPGKAYDWRISANAAMATILSSIFTTTPDSIKLKIALLEKNNQNVLAIDQNNEVTERSISYGKEIGLLVFEYSKTDGGHEANLHNFPTSYIVPKGKGLWEPTSAQLIPLQPYWGDNRPLVTSSILKSQPSNSIAYSESTGSDFYKQAREVYDVSRSLTAEQIAIAKFWSDDPGIPGTPPGHSISIATQLIKQQKLNLAEAAELYAKIGIAVSDAFVSCWKCKYTFNLLRPVTYIKKWIDPAWTTVLSTPPFPEFTSGHSVQSAATQTILESAFGKNTKVTDSTHVYRADINFPVRSFRNFEEFAKEAALSRLYGGIHYREAIDIGLIQGHKVGNEVLQLKWKK